MPHSVPQGHVDKVCKPKTTETCRYLGIGPDGWECLKHTVHAPYLDARVEAGTIRARGDNCDGTKFLEI